ncbi:MAG: TetR/AcrR family transcriptional regulator [bacterium]|nr:TetR/AcrR family transcriptional regulator [bacterium]
MTEPIDQNIDTVEGDRPPRERILAAALDLFVEQGYFNTNVPDISKKSRCSVGSIYHHFLNKEEIAQNIHKMGLDKFREEVSSAVDSIPSDNTELFIKKLVIAFMSFPERDPIVSRYLWLSRHNEFLSAGTQRPTSVGFDKLGRKMTKVIKKAVRSGIIPELPAELIWSSIFGMPVSYIRDWLDGFSKSRPSEVAPAIADACWAALMSTKE